VLSSLEEAEHLVGCSANNSWQMCYIRKDFLHHFFGLEFRVPLHSKYCEVRIIVEPHFRAEDRKVVGAPGASLTTTSNGKHLMLT
jgi:hypothetical protein